MIPVSNPRANYLVHKEEIDNAIHAVLDGGQYICGEFVEKFEEEFAAYIGVKYTIGVASGTDAIEMILRALGIGPGDEVITTSYTATGTVAPIRLVGATPVYADADASTGLIKPKSVEGCITQRTKAILPVHLYGQLCNMHALEELAEYYGIYLIEDACQAHGAVMDNRRAGSFGVAAAHSFYPTKNLNCFGDGGAITTGNNKLADRLRCMRFYDWDSNKDAQSVCGQSRLDSIHAAVLSVKLRYLDRENDRRRYLADLYQEKLQPFVSHGAAFRPIQYIPKKATCQHVFHQYSIKLTATASNYKGGVDQAFQTHGVQIGHHYPVPVHRQVAYRAHGKDSYVFDRRISLPIYPEMTEDDVECVASVFSELKT